MLVLCFSKGTFSCKKEKSTETALKLKRNGAISWNPRAGSIARDYKRSEPGTRKASEPRQFVVYASCVHHLSCLCFSLQLSRSSLSTNELSLSHHHKVLYSQHTTEARVAHPSPWISLPHPCATCWSQKINSSTMNMSASRGAGEGH